MENAFVSDRLVQQLEVEPHEPEHERHQENTDERECSCPLRPSLRNQEIASRPKQEREQGQRADDGRHARYAVTSKGTADLEQPEGRQKRPGAQ
ncbi:MAG: hypothetical protein IH936_02500 [Acidobacteria bacterium]|nr:hypothetical protein [Acidobacteriota bacterium]